MENIFKPSHLYKLYIESLDEGLISSYPDENMLKWLKNILEKEKSKGNVYSYDILSNKDPINELSDYTLSVNGKLKYSIENELSCQSGLPLYGWFIGGVKTKTFIDDDTDQFVTNKEIIIEPIYPIKNDAVEQKTKSIISNADNGLFYHVTFSKFVPKILKNGLIPNSIERKNFKHPDRTYLFDNIDDAVSFFARHQKSSLDMDSYNHMMNINSYYVGNSRKNGKSPKLAIKQPSKKDVAVFIVDLGKLIAEKGNNFKLYHDNRYNTPGAFFTTNEIDKKYLYLIPEKALAE